MSYSLEKLHMWRPDILIIHAPQLEGNYTLSEKFKTRKILWLCFWCIPHTPMLYSRAMRVACDECLWALSLMAVGCILSIVTIERKKTSRAMGTLHARNPIGGIAQKWKIIEKIGLRWGSFNIIVVKKIQKRICGGTFVRGILKHRKTIENTPRSLPIMWPNLDRSKIRVRFDPWPRLIQGHSWRTHKRRRWRDTIADSSKVIRDKPIRCNRYVTHPNSHLD